VCVSVCNVFYKAKNGQKIQQLQSEAMGRMSNYLVSAM